VLLVLAVQEAGLRSALAAQLAMAGASLITANDVDDPALTRGVRRPAVLVIDTMTVSKRDGDWLAATLEDLRWHQVVVLTDQPPLAHPKLVHCAPMQAVRVLTEKMPQWHAAAAAA
jgi:hypothetical protein